MPEEWRIARSCPRSAGAVRYPSDLPVALWRASSGILGAAGRLALRHPGMPHYEHRPATGRRMEGRIAPHRRAPARRSPPRRTVDEDGANDEPTRHALTAAANHAAYVMARRRRPYSRPPRRTATDRLDAPAPGGRGPRHCQTWDFAGVRGTRSTSGRGQVTGMGWGMRFSAPG